MATSQTCDTTEALVQRGADGAIAVIEGDRRLSYRELRERVAARAADLALGERSVVVLAGPPSTEWIVSYLALLHGGHVPLLAGDRADALIRAWRPAASVTACPDGIDVVRSPGGSTAQPPLHPDLALLLSTSGSTGSPKLVRLSKQNLVANADAIATALGIAADDVGVTSLPLHYCYGLSVLHSHLAAGAAIVAVDASVIDPCFAAAVRTGGVTSIAGVPHTFDLLETGDHAARVLAPSVRLLTQAGGRMDPRARARWESRAADQAIDLVVMYGQTEATARMAYLPPGSPAGPDAIGIPIPGGSLRIDPVADRSDGVGELVYRGPNVMMGYAVDPADLAAGPTLHELRTGDLGRFDHQHGVFEIVGRTSRFIKPFGLRIDLDVIEAQLGAVLGELAVTGDDDRLVVACPGSDPAVVQALVRDQCGLPATHVAVLTEPIPRTAAGKVDGGALLDRAAERPGTQANGAPSPDGPHLSTVLAGILGRRSVDPDDTFVSAGGDSLSYIEASMRIEQLVGSAPADWQHCTFAELDRLAPAPRRARVDTTVLLRAAGICAVVATHMHLAFFPGGAHLMLAVAGYNLSRFQLGLDHAAQRVRAGLRTVARVAVPTVLWTGAMLALGRGYGWTTLVLANNYLGPRGHEDGRWHFWFIEAYAQLCLIVLGLLAIPVVRRLDRRRPYAVPLALLGAALALRHVSIADLDDPLNLRFRTHGVAWFFVLGWLIQRSRTNGQRLVTSAVAVVAIAGFFGQPYREAFIATGLLVLIWAPTVRWPRRLIAGASTLAAASMWILISHFQIWPELASRLPLPLAYAGTLLAGVAVWKAVEAGPRAIRQLPRSWPTRDETVPPRGVGTVSC